MKWEARLEYYDAGGFLHSIKRMVAAVTMNTGFPTLPFWQEGNNLVTRLGAHLSLQCSGEWRCVKPKIVSNSEDRILFVLTPSIYTLANSIGRGTLKISTAKKVYDRGRVDQVLKVRVEQEEGGNIVVTENLDPFETYQRPHQPERRGVWRYVCETSSNYLKKAVNLLDSNAVGFDVTDTGLVIREACRLGLPHEKTVKYEIPLERLRVQSFDDLTTPLSTVYNYTVLSGVAQNLPSNTRVKLHLDAGSPLKLEVAFTPDIKATFWIPPQPT